MRLHVGSTEHLGVDVLVEGEHFPPPLIFILSRTSIKQGSTPLTGVQFQTMAMHDSDTGQGQQKVVLKRKLTGPPRLLLGKAKTVNQLGERSDARVQRHQRRMDINGTPKDSTSHDTLGEKGTAQVLPPDNLQATVKQETEGEGSHHTSLQNDCPSCDAASEEDTVKEQHLDVSRKTKKTSKQGLGLRRLFPHMFLCVRRRRDKHGDLEIKKENAMTPQPMECASDDTHSPGGAFKPGITCHSASDPEHGTGTRTGKRKIKTFWFPLIGRHADKDRCFTKESKSLSKDSEGRKKTLRKRVQGFLTRRKKAISSHQFDCIQTPRPVHAEGQVDSHLDNDKHLVHEEDIPGRDSQAGRPETMTVSAEVTATSVKGTECESKGDASEPSCEMSEDLTSRKDENKLDSCVDTQEPYEFDLKEFSGLSEGAATLTSVTEWDLGFRPQIDIAMAMDEVFQNGSDETQLFGNTSETAGPDSLMPCTNPSNMSFLTVPVEGCWSPCEASSTDVKPCHNTFDYGLPPEDISLLSGDSLLIFTANSLVRAAIKSALCQLSSEIQPTLTNSHRDECAHVEDV